MQDKKFLSNWNEARKYAFPTGAYHFFSFCKSAKEQAKNFIETVPYEPNALPPVLDLEDEANCKSGKTKEAIVAEIETLQQILFTKYQKKPILYMTEEFYYIYSMAQFKENPLWISAFYQEPNLQNGKWLFWQYSYKGFIKGIDTSVDLNVFNGTAADFGKFIKQNWLEKGLETACKSVKREILLKILRGIESNCVQYPSVFLSILRSPFCPFVQCATKENAIKAAYIGTRKTFTRHVTI